MVFLWGVSCLSVGFILIGALIYVVDNDIADERRDKAKKKAAPGNKPKGHE